MRLLALAWTSFLRERRLPTYVYSEGAVCFYFTGGLVDKDKLFFKDAEGKRRWRAVIGFKSVGNRVAGRRKTLLALWRQPVTCSLSNIRVCRKATRAVLRQRCCYLGAEGGAA